VDVVAVALQRPGPPAVQGQLQGRGAEYRPLIGQLQLVFLSAVVEPGRTLEHEPELAADTAHHPDQPVPIGGLLRILHRHEVQDLTDPAGGHEPGDQDGRVREVQLADHDIVALGGDPEVPAALAVQQGAEHTRRVEPRTTEPVHATVSGHQRSGLQISDQSVLGNRRVAIH
jgi:hypothetical protein